MDRGFERLLLGAVVGTIVLGLGGRAAMALLALATGHPMNLSSRSVIEAVLVGTLVGAIGGLLLFPIRRCLPGSSVLRGGALGLILLLVSVAVSWLTGKLDFGVTTAMWPTLIAAAIGFGLYGFTLDRLASRG